MKLGEDRISDWERENIRAISRNGAEILRREFQSNLGPAGWAFLPRLIDEGFRVNVKVTFSDEASVEHMWVQAVHVDLTDGLLTGRVCNEPLNLTHVSPGDTVTVGLGEIMAARYELPDNGN